MCEAVLSMISEDQEVSALNHLTTVLPTSPCVDWAAASQHCGLIKCNICFLKEKLHSLYHSLPFMMVLGIMVVRMVLHIIKFVNGFPCWGGVKHFSPGEIMTGRCLHKSNIALYFGVYCQVAENVQPRKCLAPRMQAAILVSSSGNLSGGQIFLVLDTDHTIMRHQWVALPMPPAVIDRVICLASASLPSSLSPTGTAGILVITTHRTPNLLEFWMMIRLSFILPRKSQEWIRLRTLLKLQEWTLTLMLSPQEWIWTPIRGPWTPMPQLTITLLQ